MIEIFIISFIILVVDIISKRLVINYMFYDMSVNIIDGFFRITYARNMGIAFSILDGHVDFIVLMTIAVLVMIYKYIKSNVSSKCDKISYAFIIGGAVGNLIDRIFYGYVVDFLDFNIFGYNFPIFNLADTFIVIGVFVLIVNGFREDGGKNEVNSRR